MFLLLEGKALASMMALEAIEFCSMSEALGSARKDPGEQRVAASIIVDRKKEVRLKGTCAHTHRDIAEEPSGLWPPDCTLPSLLRLRESLSAGGGGGGGMKNGSPEHLQRPSNCFHSSSKGLYSPRFSGLPNMALYCLRELPMMTFKPPES